MSEINIYNVFFLLQFVCVLGIFLYKLYNVISFNKGKDGLVYDMRISIILFISFWFCWLVGLVVLLLDPSELLYSTLFRLETWLILPNVLFLFIEIFYYLRDESKQPIKPNMSLNNFR